MLTRQVTGLSKFRLLILFYLSSISPISGHLWAKNLPIRHYFSDDGLVQNDINAGYQDRQGYIWFVTYGGISRFDGKNFINFTPNNSDLKPTIVRAITQDSEHQMWFGYSSGISKFDGSNFTHFDLEKGGLGKEVFQLYADPTKGIWLVTESGVSYFSDNVFKNYSSPELHVSGSRYSYITGTPAGEVYVATEKGLYKWTPHNPTFQGVSNIKGAIFALTYHPELKHVYFSDGENLYQLDHDVATLLDHSGLGGKIICMTSGIHDTVWLSTETSVWKWTPKGSTILSPNDLKDPTISSIFEDREGNLWLTCWGGAYMVVSSKITHYTGSNLKVITKIIQDRDKNLYIGSDQGLHKLKASGESEFYVNTPFINGLLCDRDQIWVCTNQGLFQYDTQGQMLKKWKENLSFNSISKDRKGKIWISSYEGLYSLQDQELKLEMNTESGLKSNVIWPIFEDNSGNLWVGTENGLSRRSEGTWVHYTESDGLSNNSIWDFVMLNRDVMLIATNNGISTWKDGKFETLPILQKLPIHSLQIDANHKLWVGTDHGVYRLSTTFEVELFLNKSSGLCSNSTYLPQSSCVDEAHYWVGTYNGFNRIDLDFHRAVYNVPRLDMSGVDINDIPCKLNALLTPLACSNRNITFQFNAIFMSNPDSVQYQYRLKGWDRDWRPKTALTQAVYTNLPYGEYTFTVQAFDGNLAGETKSLSFKIMHPFWLSWWFIVLVALGLAMAMILLASLWYKRKLNISQEKLLKSQAERKYLDRLNVSYHRFVPQKLLLHLGKNSIEDIELGDCVEREMTIIFSDIRSFTSLSEQMSPEENFKFLNSYLSRMQPIINEHGGFVDKFMGDGIMALFENNVENAIDSAIAMQKDVQLYNTYRKKCGYSAIEVGIGIHHGFLMLGTIGGKDRMDGTVISDAVNLTSRIEDLTKAYGVSLLVSDAVFNKINNPSAYNMRKIDSVTVKGRNRPVVLYEIFDGDPPEIQAKKTE